MAGRGPAPKDERYRRGNPARGDWQPSPDGGWQHDLPEPPPGISPAAQLVWTGWFTAWWAGNWTPDDLPTLGFVIRLWDRVNRGDVKRAAELRQWLDGFGITPKGQMDRRWRRPDPPKPMTPFERIRQEAAAIRGGGRYDHLQGQAQPGSRFRFKDLPGGSAAPRNSRFAVLDDDPKARYRTIEADLD